jgi:hypothetical protein
MKKILGFLTLLCLFATLSFGQASTDLGKRTTIKQNSDKTVLAKKTIVQPKSPTNWSKIKDLFR